MFLEFYNLKEQPFGVTPDPRYLYFSPGHREALASLFYGIETGRGFLSLIADPGMGKTTLLFQLLQRWKGYVHSAFLFQTQCNSRELLGYLLEDLGLRNNGKDIVRMHSELNEFLYRETKAGRRIVVFIDEAQNLSDSVLETVRLLSDFEAPDKKLLQIILAGQPELAERLSRPGLAQLRQRIAVQTRLEALPALEVIRYVEHRLKVAGYEGPELFTTEAMDLIAARSRGIPRLVNHLCFNALSLGCASEQRQIDASIARDAADDFTMGDRIDPKPAVRQHLAVRDTLHAFHKSLQSICSWTRTSLLRKRLFQGSVLLLAVSSLGIYVGARTRSATTQSPTVRQVSSTARAAAPHSEPLSESHIIGASQSKASAATKQPAAMDSSTGSFNYMIQPKDTLRDLCMWTLGRYDKSVLSEVRQLNPDLKDFEHLKAGQEIRLPTPVRN